MTAAETAPTLPAIGAAPGAVPLTGHANAPSFPAGLSVGPVSARAQKT